MKLAYLIVYAIIMCVIATRSILKKENAFYCSLWIAYAISAVFCVISKIYQKEFIGTGIMQNIWYDLSDTTLWGYLLIVLCCLISFQAFKYFDYKSAFGNYGKDSTTKTMFVLFAILYVMMALLFLLLSISSIKSILSVQDYGALRSDLYGNSENEATITVTTNFLANICFKICLQLKYLSVFVAVGMIKERVKPLLAGIMLVLTFAVYYINSVATAARGGLLIFTVCAVLIVCGLYKYLSTADQGKVLIMAGVAAAIVLSFFIAVTVSRFSANMQGSNAFLYYISFYLGHGPIEFSKITGSLEHFGLGKAIIGRLLNHYFNTPYSWENIQTQIGYPGIGPVYTTYLGYLYTDFSAIGCLIFTYVWSRFMIKILKNRPTRFSTLFFFSYYLNYFVTGMFTASRLEYAALITTCVLYFMLRIIEGYFIGAEQGKRNVIILDKRQEV